MVSNTDGVGRILSVMDTLNPMCVRWSAQAVMSCLIWLLSNCVKSTVTAPTVSSMWWSTPNECVNQTYEQHEEQT